MILETLYFIHFLSKDFLYFQKVKLILVSNHVRLFNFADFDLNYYLMLFLGCFLSLIVIILYISLIVIEFIHFEAIESN